MIDAIRRSFAFVAWSNFLDVRVYALWIGGLAALALIGYVAWHAGALVYRRRQFESATEQLAAYLTAGFAVMTVPILALGAVGLYRPIAVAVLGAAVVSVSLFRRDQSLGRAFLGPPTGLRASFNEHRLLWALFLVCSLPALLPPYRVDEVAYHLAQAQQWVTAGRLTVDRFILYPLYANNWHLLQGVGLMFGGARLTHLETWLAGVLATLLVRVMLPRLGVGAPLSNIATVALFVSPLFQRYLTVGVIDVPLMLYLTAASYGFMELARTEGRPEAGQVIAAAACAGMFVGMKSVNLIYVPLFAGLIVYHVRPWRSRLFTTAVAVFALVGAPWYVRNLVLVGDPAPPLVHHALGLPDPDWTEDDIQGVANTLHEGRSRAPMALLALPVRMLTATEAGPMADWPVLGYALLLPGSLLLFWRLRRARALPLLIVSWYAVAVWIATSYMIRYSHFLPLAAVLGGLLVHTGLERLGLAGRRPVVLLAGIILLIGPTLSAPRYIKTPFSAKIPVDASTAWRFEQAWSPEAGLIDRVADVAAPHDTVYSVGLYYLKYYFEKRGFYLIGHEAHIGRYSDLRNALDGGAGDQFFASLHASTVVLYKPRAWISLKLPADSAVSALAATPTLRLVYEDSLGAVFRVSRPPPRPVP